MNKPKQPSSEDLMELIQSEVFLAFFTFAQPAGTGAELTGLVKVARPAGDSGAVDYLSLTFVADTPTDAVFQFARHMFGKISKPEFAKYLKNLKAVTSVPATGFAGPHYIHQLDLVFKTPLPQEISPLLRDVTIAVRHALGVLTEPPQAWEDPDVAPKKTEAEKANFFARIKAIIESL